MVNAGIQTQNGKGTHTQRPGQHLEGRHGGWAMMNTRFGTCRISTTDMSWFTI